MMYLVIGLTLYVGGFAGLLWDKSDKVSAVSAVCVIGGYLLSFGALI